MNDIMKADSRIKKEGIEQEKPEEQNGQIQIEDNNQRQNLYNIDEKFFIDFINEDMNKLGQKFNDQQLNNIAQALNFLDEMQEDDYAQNDNDNSISTRDRHKKQDEYILDLIREEEDVYEPSSVNLQNQLLLNAEQLNPSGTTNITSRNNQIISNGGESSSSEYVKSKFQRNGLSPDSYRQQQIETQSNGGNSQRESQRDLLRNSSLKSSMKRKQLNSEDQIMEVNMQKRKVKKVTLQGSKSLYQKKKPSDSKFYIKQKSVQSPINQTILTTSLNQNGQTQLYDASNSTKNKNRKVVPMGAGWYNQNFISIKENGIETVNPDIIQSHESKFNKEFLVKDDVGLHKKIYLRRDKFDFKKYTEDIFEQREKLRRQKEEDDTKKAQINSPKDWGIEPYQKKTYYEEKKFKADDEQIEYLAFLGLEPNELVKLIQKKYDEPYLSNLIFTGTLSIGIEIKRSNDPNFRVRKLLHKDFLEVKPEIARQSSIEENRQAQVPAIGRLSHIMRKNVLDKDPEQKESQTELEFQNEIKKNIMIKTLKTNKFNVKNNLGLLKQKTQGLQISHDKTPSKLFNQLSKQISDISDPQITNARKKEALLKKQAARDANFQKRLIINKINKDSYRSNIFRQMLIKVRNSGRKTEFFEGEEVKDDDEDDSDEDEDSSDDENNKDDFLDLDFDCNFQIMSAKHYSTNMKKSFVQWSGQDVLEDFDPSLALIATQYLSKVRVWPQGIYCYLKIFQCLIKKVIRNPFFDNFMTLSVAINTAVLSQDRYKLDTEYPDYSNTLTVMNTIFTYIFIAEMGLKLIGLGPIKYLKDRMNYLDAGVVMLSIVELSFSTPGNKNKALSAFRSIRIFRTFRVLRVARLLRSLQSMQIILAVLIKSLSSFLYLALLLFLFVFIYALLGMQLFGGKFYFQDVGDGTPGIPIQNFDSFNTAFITIFQLLTMENWQVILYNCLRCSSVIQPISVIYLISWIFLGNYMLLNLFLAILLDSFTEEDHKKKESEDIELQKKKHEEEFAKKRGKDLIDYFLQEKANVDHKKDMKSFGKKKIKKKKKVDENLLIDSFEIDQDFLTRKSTIQKKGKKQFDGVECNRSFYLFSQRNMLRKFLYRLQSYFAFEMVILGLIVLSSIKLVTDTYMFNTTSTLLTKVSDSLDLFFTSAFAMECTIKAIALGFFMDKGSYLRETWNQLDFFIVATSIIDASFDNVDIPIIKILRLLRTLRPLRFISHNSAMKTIVTALLSSFGGIFNVVIVVMAVWLMFAILAVNLFAGKSQYCTVHKFLADNERECNYYQGEWKTSNYNFDSVPDAMLTLFIVASQENWPDVMFQMVQSTKAGYGPKPNASPLNAYFFVVFMFIGSFLFLNLFVGVIFMQFEEAQNDEIASMHMDSKEIKWVDMMKMIVNATPDIETTTQPKNKIRKLIHKFVTGAGQATNKFDIFIMTIIVCNMIIMAVQYEGSSLRFNNVLESINYAFTAIFVIEAILKLIAFGASYFKMGWNIFDFCVICASLFDIFMGQSAGSNLKFLRVGPQLARVMRVLRVSRLFRLINKYKGLQALIQTITFSLPSLFNVFSLLMLMYFIFAVLGTFLFKDVVLIEGGALDDQNNFKNFGNAMILMIRMSTGENWPNFMFECRSSCNKKDVSQCKNNPIAPIFFIAFIMICSFIMLNLFILVIIQQFETYYLQDDNVLKQFKDNLELFKEKWTFYTKDHNCLKIKDVKLVPFFASMEEPLGMRQYTKNSIIKEIVLMDLQSDEEGFVYFNELLFKAMKREYGVLHIKNKILAEHELKAMRKIENIKQRMIKRSRHEERVVAVSANPFLLRMMQNISFKAWLKIYKLNQPLREKQKNGDEPGEIEIESALDEQQVKEQEHLTEYITEDDVSLNDDEQFFYGAGGYATQSWRNNNTMSINENKNHLLTPQHAYYYRPQVQQNISVGMLISNNTLESRQNSEPSQLQITKNFSQKQHTSPRFGGSNLASPFKNHNLNVTKLDQFELKDNEHIATLDDVVNKNVNAGSFKQGIDHSFSNQNKNLETSRSAANRYFEEDQGEEEEEKKTFQRE